MTLKCRRRDDCIVNLPLWSPSAIEIGSVGYLRKPEGEFVTLFNAFDPPQTSGGVLESMPNLYGYGRVSKGSQRQDKRNRAQRGFDTLERRRPLELDLCVHPPTNIGHSLQLGAGTTSADDIRSVSRLIASSRSYVLSQRCTITLRICLPLRGGSRLMWTKY